MPCGDSKLGNEKRSNQIIREMLIFVKNNLIPTSVGGFGITKTTSSINHKYSN